MTENTPEVTRAGWPDRLLSALPLLLAYLVLLMIYAWQASRHSAPWLFTDELQWAGLSRAVSHDGVPALRLQHQGFDSLYEYLIAPAWWASTTTSGYGIAKDIGAAVMTAGLFPAYALARLALPRPAAIAAAVASTAIPAFYFTGLLIPEPFAYTWSALTLWLVARALVRPERRRTVAAVVALAIAPAVRSELTVLILAAGLAALIVYGTGERGRSTVAAWSRRERIGAIVLALGVVVCFGAFAGHHSYSWQVGGHFHHRMFTYGLWAIGAFTIGLGVVPVVLALAWVMSCRFRGTDERALGALLIGSTVAFVLYTAIKASFLSTQFAIRVEERNLIYLAPLVFVAAARWALDARTRLVPSILAVAGVGYLLWSTPYHNYEHFYSDAPGLSVLQWLNQKDYWTTTDARRLLFGILALSAVALVAKRFARAPQIRRAAAPAAALLAVCVIGWNLWGEIAAANASNDFSRTVAALPSPPDWIDRATNNERALFIGQSLASDNAFWSIEFWNPSLQYIWSVDATAPGPGPVRTPNYLDTTGAIDPQIPVHWVVAAPGVDPVGTLVEEAGGLRLYRVTHPIRIRDAEGLISTDANWMVNNAWYYHFAPNGPRQGTATVTLSRGAACGDLPASPITVKVSSLYINGPRTTNGQPVPKRLLAVRHVLLRSNPCDTKTLTFHVKTPYRIDLSTTKTFQPPNDSRQLSAQVTFGFKAD